jgi:hypothetical protein
MITRYCAGTSLPFLALAANFIRNTAVDPRNAQEMISAQPKYQGVLTAPSAGQNMT